ncbi:MAG: phosphopyruvate hydratase [Candidatus Vogelbacteria bacterium RIFOXYD1_FULL_46_19]|uniref:Enolase n=1 Tax=Candidatus Vogelbacteria bacterium RIFOXYD1_FULL_46_19 TaxID=1802439 RepID=A0A1G2QG65_9BACT|nr:MAG: phosphopyruvate hydratase [Candidatus Vogelbacteria bacterium RIFOXYD1_FULL_46_19]
MFKIISIKGREILDSRGQPTVEVDVTLEGGSRGRAAVPSGASTGSHEAVELRDGGERYRGRGVKQVVENINEVIAPALVGETWMVESLDKKLIELDGTADKSHLGANAILAVSLSFAKAAAAATNWPLYRYVGELAGTTKLLLPRPMINILNGGQHASNSTDLQEFMIMPLRAPTYQEALRVGVEVFQALKDILKGRGLNTTVGDEGGFAPILPTNEVALELLMEAISQAGFKPGEEVGLALDVAATEFYQDGQYLLKSEGRSLEASEMMELYQTWINKYPIVSIEDGLAEDDWDNFGQMTKVLGSKIQIVGDDLLVTNLERLTKAIEGQTANAILIKPNQIGTLTETMAVVKAAQAAGWRTIMSHRSGETEDTTIADLAVGLACGQIKTGSVCRGERTAKYNQLLRIEEELGSEGAFASRSELGF